MADTTQGALAPTYHPLPITIARAQGTHVWDTDGNEFLDFLSGYSALNFGHLHQGLVAAAMSQLRQVTLTSRAFDHERLEEFAQRLVDVVGPLTTGGEDSLVVPMNTGAEAVETAIKAVRKWGYDVRGVPEDAATVVVAAGSFHGRTTTLVGLSDDPVARGGFGPFAPGFRQVPFGDLQAVADAVDDTTVAVLMEPVQGEAGVLVPPGDFWPGLRELTARKNIALVADEVQSGLGRTGTTIACELWGVRPDLVCLGKALGGGIVPVSAVVGRPEILGVLTPGTHGSTFGGNPLACAVGIAALDLLSTGQYQARAAASGVVLKERLDALVDRGLLTGARTVGLWAGIDVDPAFGTGRELCEALLERGVLATDTHGATIRLSPPLSIVQPELEMALDIVEESLVALREEGPGDVSVESVEVGDAAGGAVGDAADSAVGDAADSAVDGAGEELGTAATVSGDVAAPESAGVLGSQPSADPDDAAAGPAPEASGAPRTETPAETPSTTPAKTPTKTTAKTPAKARSKAPGRTAAKSSARKPRGKPSVAAVAEATPAGTTATEAAVADTTVADVRDGGSADEGKGKRSELSPTAG